MQTLFADFFLFQQLVEYLSGIEFSTSKMYKRWSLLSSNIGAVIIYDTNSHSIRNKYNRVDDSISYYRKKFHNCQNPQLNQHLTQPNITLVGLDTKMTLHTTQPPHPPPHKLNVRNIVKTPTQPKLNST